MTVDDRHSEDVRAGVIARLHSSFRRRGTRATVQLLAAEARQRSRIPRRVASNGWFDIVNGVETRGIVRHGAAFGADAVDYVPVGAPTFRRAMSHPAVPHGPDRVFLDLGCGKGKAVLMASSYGFKRAIGVELSPDLAAIAQTNVERYRRRHSDAAPTEVVCADATECPIPPEPLLVYLHNPFHGEVLAVVLSRLANSARASPREIALLYHSPVHRSALDSLDFIEPIADVYGGILYAVRADGRKEFGPEPAS